MIEFALRSPFIQTLSADSLPPLVEVFSLVVSWESQYPRIKLNEYHVTMLATMHTRQFRLSVFAFCPRAFFSIVALLVIVSTETVGDEPEYSEGERAHWSFKKLQIVAPPDVADHSNVRWGKTPIDAFILERLREEESTPCCARQSS